MTLNFDGNKKAVNENLNHKNRNSARVKVNLEQSNLNLVFGGREAQEHE